MLSIIEFRLNIRNLRLIKKFNVVCTLLNPKLNHNH